MPSITHGISIYLSSYLHSSKIVLVFAYIRKTLNYSIPRRDITLSKVLRSDLISLSWIISFSSWATISSRWWLSSLRSTTTSRSRFWSSASDALYPLREEDLLTQPHCIRKLTKQDSWGELSQCSAGCPLRMGWWLLTSIDSSQPLMKTGATSRVSRNAQNGAGERGFTFRNKSSRLRYISLRAPLDDRLLNCHIWLDRFHRCRFSRRDLRSRPAFRPTCREESKGCSKLSGRRRQS